MTSKSMLAATYAVVSSAASFAEPPFDDASGYLVGHRHPIESEPCIETSDILGYRRCPGFGAWADARQSPQVTFEAGVFMRHLARPPEQRASLLGLSALAIAPPSSSADVVGWDLRVTFGVQRYLYIGIETDMAEVAHGNIEDFDAVIGVNGAVGMLVLGAEVVGGARRFGIDVDTTYIPVLEPRLRASFWLSPWIALGGQVGASVIDQDTWMAGVYLGLHTYAYGGLR